MLKSIDLRIWDKDGVSVLICDGCKEMLCYHSRDFVKRIAEERGWEYDNDKVYCRDCSRRNKHKEEV